MIEREEHASQRGNRLPQRERQRLHAAGDFELAGVLFLLDYPREERETTCSLAGKRLKPSQVVVLFLNG